jgi:hypothetical protein
LRKSTFKLDGRRERGMDMGLDTLDMGMGVTRMDIDISYTFDN